MTLALPRNAAELTPDWLTRALRAELLDGAVVTGARLTQIGQDQSFTGGAIYRIALDYDRPGAGPRSMVAKLSPDDARLAKALFAANRREVAFYDRVAGQGDLPVPQCHYSAADPAQLASVILMKDLSQARYVPFAAGWSGHNAADVVETLAIIHAHWWQRSDLASIDGAGLPDEFDLAGCWAQYPARLADLLGKVDLPPGFLALGDQLVTDRARIFDKLSATGPVTCLHRDPQADNVMFDGDGRVILLDWQMTGVGRGASDVTYALVSSCTPAVRRASEAELVGRYHQALCRRGVTGYGLEDCRRDYLRGVAGKVVMTVVATVLFDNASDHKRAWRRTDLDRLLSFLADRGIGPATFA